ncbi:unnamed protein product [Dibothriocephalus latus]|uniref:Uncharacterized protein n=1 Tax=Dibothriocephalus latus TaxID=60516 RepID=A0A3P7KWH7_DIBLA|nr:unnamed protein product [Dibothriocephalus latus]
MGIGHSALSPLPPYYFTVTFRQPDELWIFQPPVKLLLFIRSLLIYLWPDEPIQQKQCNGKPSRRSKKADDGQAKPNVMANTFFRIPGRPFVLPSDTHGIRESGKAYKFATILISYVHHLGYALVSSGHFIRGIEAYTCIFRLKQGLQASAGELPQDAVPGSHFLTNKNACFRRRKRENSFDWSSFHPFSAVGLEGWNRIYFININKDLFADIKTALQELWVEGFEQAGCLHFSAESSLPPVSGAETDFLLEFCGHPWDSYKPHSDLSPYLLMRILEKMTQANFQFICNVNFRGSLDTLLFAPKQEASSSMTFSRSMTQAYFVLCHQDCVRVYNGSEALCGWVSRLFQQIWAPGVMMEKQVTFTNNVPEEAEPGFDTFKEAAGANEKNGSGEDRNLGYTEIRLNGCPWWIAEWNKDALLAAKYLMTRFGSVLALTGWRCFASVNMYCSPYDKCLLIFEKELGTKNEQTTMDLEQIELHENTSNKLCKPIDLLMPVCISTYDTDQICILGGSTVFLRHLHMRFSNLFGSAKYLSDKDEHALKDAEEPEFAFKNWMPLKGFFVPETLHCKLLDEKTLLCLTITSEKSHFPTHNTALISINDNDPDSCLEYGLTYQPWDGLVNWPPNTYKKAADKRINKYLCRQLPLSLLCWIHELVVTTPSGPATLTSGTVEDQDAIDTISDTPLKKGSENELFLCTDYSSVTKHSPPTWMYLVRERKYDLVTVSGNARVNF